MLRGREARNAWAWVARAVTETQGLRQAVDIRNGMNSQHRCRTLSMRDQECITATRMHGLTHERARPWPAPTATRPQTHPGARAGPAAPTSPGRGGSGAGGRRAVEGRRANERGFPSWPPGAAPRKPRGELRTAPRGASRRSIRPGRGKEGPARAGGLRGGARARWAVLRHEGRRGAAAAGGRAAVAERGA